MTHPLVPADVDLRDFAFMPLDVVRLRDSDLAALEEPATCWAAVLLWCASWHQLPAASLPDDDRVLANLAGFGRVVREWAKVKEGALRGWVRCSDGRLYHPVVAEKALDAWRSKQAQRWRTECGRIKKHNQRHKLEGSDAIPFPEFDDWLSQGCPQGQPLPVPGTKPPRPREVPGETGSKGQGEGQGQGQGQGDLKGANAPSAPAASPAVAARVALVARFKAAEILPSPTALLDQLVAADVTWEEIEPLLPTARKSRAALAYIAAAIAGQRERAANTVIPPKVDAPTATVVANPEIAATAKRLADEAARPIVKPPAELLARRNARHAGEPT